MCCMAHSDTPCQFIQIKRAPHQSSGRPSNESNPAMRTLLNFDCWSSSLYVIVNIPTLYIPNFPAQKLFFLIAGWRLQSCNVPAKKSYEARKRGGERKSEGIRFQVGVGTHPSHGVHWLRYRVTSVCRVLYLIAESVAKKRRKLLGEGVQEFVTTIIMLCIVIIVLFLSNATSHSKSNKQINQAIEELANSQWEGERREGHHGIFQLQNDKEQHQHAEAYMTIGWITNRR